jgi:hypothetical protein
VAQFYKDRLIPIAFQYNFNPIRVVFAENHNLITNDTIIINGLTTLNDGANSTILTALNNPRGLKITVINPTTISINGDHSAIIDIDEFSLPIIIFPSKTFRIPLEIGYKHSDENA